MEEDLPILVTGAEGFTGKFVCIELLKRGIFFKASIKPNKSKKWFLDRNIEAIETDINKKDQLIKSLKGCKGLININSIALCKYHSQIIRYISLIATIFLVLCYLQK